MAEGLREAVEEFTRIAVDGGRTAWVGLPIVDWKERWPVMQRQNDIFERVVGVIPNALYVDTWDRFATRDGDYTPFYWFDGRVELVRASDGCTNPRGYELVAQAVGDAVVEEFGLTPAALSSSTRRPRPPTQTGIGTSGRFASAALLGRVELEVGQRPRGSRRRPACRSGRARRG